MERDESRRFRQWKYILDGHTPVQVEDPITWARWMETAPEERRRVGVWTHEEDIMVSTIFLGLDHSWALGSEPLLFETMIFWPANARLDEYQRRYSTWEAAETGHNEAVRLVQLALRKGGLFVVRPTPE